MLRITNKSFGPLCFREPPTDDEPIGPIVEILEGETKSVNTTRENVNVAAYIETRLIEVAAEEVEDKPAPKEPRTKTKGDVATGENSTPAA